MANNQNIRLVDIAKKVGVSTATVSIVLNDNDTNRVSVETKKKIIDTAKELNYVPNLAARSLAIKETKMIGLIIPDIENPFFASLVKETENNLSSHGYTLMTTSSNGEIERELNQVKQLIARGIDAIMISTSAHDIQSMMILKKELKRYLLPIVLLDRTVRDFNIDQVVFDNIYGGKLATELLIEHGHDKIGHISSISQSSSGYDRYIGYKQALKENNISYNSKIVIDDSFDYSSGYENAANLINKGVTAIFAGNDLIAFGVMAKCKELGIIVGEDISLVGYDNLTVNDYLNTELTSINQDISELSKNGVELIIGMINSAKSSEQEKYKVVQLLPNLVIRNSVSIKKCSAVRENHEEGSI